MIGARCPRCGWLPATDPRMQGASWLRNLACSCPPEDQEPVEAIVPERSKIDGQAVDLPPAPPCWQITLASSAGDEERFQIEAADLSEARQVAHDRAQLRNEVRAPEAEDLVGWLQWQQEHGFQVERVERASV